MARIRTIKPEFWTDGRIVRLSPEARLFFIGLWNFARCDNGHLDDDALGLKLKIFPADNIDARALIDELINGGLLDRYAADDRGFLHIRRFAEHQKVDDRWKSRCPYCALGDSPKLAESHRNSPNHTVGKERKGKEGNGKELTTPDGVVVRAVGDGPESLPAANGKSDSEGIPPCPRERIVALYHETLPMCPRIRVWNGTRAASLRQRWREMPALDEWQAYFDRVRGSPFLTGLTPPRNGSSSFVADLEWLIKPTNFAKVIEGRYDGDRQRNH